MGLSHLYAPVTDLIPDCLFQSVWRANSLEQEQEFPSGADEHHKGTLSSDEHHKGTAFLWGRDRWFDSSPLSVWGVSQALFFSVTHAAFTASTGSVQCHPFYGWWGDRAGAESSGEPRGACCSARWPCHEEWRPWALPSRLVCSVRIYATLTGSLVCL